jgi:hypothetical protein
MKYLESTTVAWLIDENVPLPIHTALAGGYGPGQQNPLSWPGPSRPGLRLVVPTDRHPDSRQATVKCPQMASSGCTA